METFVIRVFHGMLQSVGASQWNKHDHLGTSSRVRQCLLFLRFPSSSRCKFQGSSNRSTSHALASAMHGARQSIMDPNSDVEYKELHMSRLFSLVFYYPLFFFSRVRHQGASRTVNKTDRQQCCWVSCNFWKRLWRPDYQHRLWCTCVCSSCPLGWWDGLIVIPGSWRPLLMICPPADRSPPGVCCSAGLQINAYCVFNVC